MSHLFLLFVTALMAECADAPPTIEKAMQLVTVGKLEQAAAMLSELEKLNPRDPEIAYRFGLVLLKQSKIEDARERLELAAKLAPGRPFIGAALGLLHESLAKSALSHNDAPIAAKDFQEAIRLDPARTVYYLELAQLLLDHATPEPAELVLTNAARRFPNNADVLRLLGLTQYALGKTKEALEVFLKAIDADPDNESAYASLQTLLPDAQQRLPEIVVKLRAFFERHPESPIGPFLLALIEPAESEALLRRAIQGLRNSGRLISSCTNEGPVRRMGDVGYLELAERISAQYHFKRRPLFDC